MVGDLTVMNFHSVFGQDADVRDVVLMAVHELEKGLQVCEFSVMDLVGALTKPNPHGFHVVTVQRNPLSSLVVGDVGGALFFGRTVVGPSVGSSFSFNYVLM